MLEWAAPVSNFPCVLMPETLIQPSDSHTKERYERELERWLRGQEHSLLFRRTRIIFPAPTWDPTTVYVSSSRESNTFFWLP